MPHLFVDISSHGFGHLAQTAPILNALTARLSGLPLTIRSGLPRERLAQRISAPFTYLSVASDFGYVMHDPMRIDRAATAGRYRTAHADWPRAVADEAALLRRLGVDFVFANVSYLPLAGAAQAGIPAAACCCLNWAELFDHFYGGEDWAAPVAAQIHAAYAAAPFLALEPAMPMTALPRVLRFPPVAELAAPQRDALLARLPQARGRRLVLVGFGGIAMNDTAFDLAGWARRARVLGLDCCWLVPAGWGGGDPDCVAVEASGLTFSELLATCDAVITKPGYGTFVEAACAGTPVLWLRRDEWPEQHCLIDWLGQNVAARELSAVELAAGTVPEALAALWEAPRPPRPQPLGSADVADWLARHLGR